METLYANKYTGATGTNYTTAFDSFIVPWLGTYFSKFNNLTYIGKASFSTNCKLGIFQIDSNENYYLGIGNYYTSNANHDCITIGIRGSDSLTDTTRLGSNLPVNVSGRTSWPAGNASQFSNYIYSISDTDGNLKVLWTPNPTYDSRTQSQPVILAKTVNNRNVIIQFTTIQSSSQIFNDYAPNVFFLDDGTHTNYYIGRTVRSNAVYDSQTDVLKLNYLPITTTENGTIVVDMINDKLVRIFNVSLEAVTNQAHNNTTGWVRKLIRIGNTYYRQILNDWWYEDPKGDEEIIVDDDTIFSS